MLTTFSRPADSKDLYFGLNNSFQIIHPEYQSSTFKYAGLYAIYKNDICYYVGQSQNLASRVSQHLNGKYSTCDRIELYLVTEIDDFSIMGKQERKSFLEHNEMTLMSILKPIENLLTPNDYHDTESIPLLHGVECLNYDEDGGSIVDLTIRVFKYDIAVHEYSFLDTYNMDVFNLHNKKLFDDIDKFGLDSIKKGLNHG